MLVLMKIGKYAGEVREVEFAVGRDLVAGGGADQVFHDDRAKPPVPVKLLASYPAIEASRTDGRESEADTSRAKPVAPAARRSAKRNR